MQDTPVLKADWSWAAISELRPGDAVVCIEQPSQRGKHVKLATASVTRLSWRSAPTVVINERVRCTREHELWLTGRDANGRAGAAHSGWRQVERTSGLRVLFTTDPIIHDETLYRRGWLAGMADGDGCFWTLKFRRGYRRFRLALNDTTLLDRAMQYAATAGFELRPGSHATIGFTAEQRNMDALWLTADERAREFERWLKEDIPDRSWFAGYLGGILDAEGSHSVGVLRIAQSTVNGPTRARIEHILTALGLDHTVENKGFYIHSAAGQAWTALSLAKPAKQSLLDSALGRHPHASRVVQPVVPTNEVEDVVALTTTSGSYVAGGYVVKCCDRGARGGTGHTIPGLPSLSA